MKQTISIKQIVLKVSNLQRSSDFYQHILKFGVKKVSQKEAHVFVDSSQSLIILKEITDVQPIKKTTGLYHIAILLPNRIFLGQLLHHFKQIQFMIDGASDHLVSEAIYLHDPDGNGIEIYVDKKRSSWVYQGQMVMMDTLPLPINDLLGLSAYHPSFQLPTDTAIGHIHLHVHQINASKLYYIDTLGFDLMFEFSSAVFVSYDAYHHHIGFNVWNGINAPAPSTNSVGLEYVTFDVHQNDVYEQMKQNITKKGYYMEDHDSYFITKDPSMNTLWIEKNNKNL
jgi:catechol 2,3-dioxygenase